MSDATNQPERFQSYIGHTAPAILDTATNRLALFYTVLSMSIALNALNQGNVNPEHLDWKSAAEPQPQLSYV